MNLSPEKRNSLIKLGAGTAAVVIVMWLFVINPTRAQMEQKLKAQKELTQKISDKTKIIHAADRIAATFAETSAQLSAIEEQMVSGDPYLWIIKTLGEFEASHQMEFSKYDPPHSVDAMLPNNVPYKVVGFSVTGAAHYHNLGAFIASLENTHPFIRVHRLELEPVPGQEKVDEKLSFLIELYVLVKPSSPTASVGKL